MKKVVLIIFILLFVLLIWYFLYHENTDLEITRYNIIDKRISNNFVIAQISDYHNDKHKKLNDKIIENLKNIKPNIIVITGDLVDSRRTDINEKINFIKKLNSIAKIYYVNGNHESRIDDYELLKEKLIDNYRVINLEDGKINIVGVNDPDFNNDNIKDEEIIKNEIKSIEYDKYIYTVLLSHRPELFKIYKDENVNLILSGHAHGGQIRLPFIGGLIAPNQGLLPKYTSGIYKSNETNMIVSRGIGNSLAPFRINNKPELVIVELNKME